MPVINQDSKLFQANTIFLQPTWSCAKKCDGCYVKEKESQYGSTEMSLEVWAAVIFELMYGGAKLQSGQVTMALDALPSDYDQCMKMLDIAWTYFDAVKNRTPGTECHITVNHVNDLMKYLDEDQDGHYEVIENLDLLSISNILSVDQVETAKLRVPGAKINWNVTSGEFVSQVKRQGLDEVKQIIRKVDSVYILLHKAPMGESGHAMSDFFQAVKLIQDLKESAPITDGTACAVPSLLSKINLDGCMNDSVQFLKKGFGCSSNVSRYQIWPDGRVTGCAYNSQQQYGNFAETLQDVLTNLKDARNRYEFSGRNAGKPCTIPSELKDYSDKKHLQVTT